MERTLLNLDGKVAVVTGAGKRRQEFSYSPVTVRTNTKAIAVGDGRYR